MAWRKHTQALEFLSVGSVQIGAILLCGLFVYDIFWVFCTPVMVAVAKSFDAPIKLLFPRMLASLLSGEVSLPLTPMPYGSIAAASAARVAPVSWHG
jgi:minor histocompatibility antigen H13